MFQAVPAITPSIASECEPKLTNRALTREQMMFMLHYQNMIEAAYAFQDSTRLLSIAESNEFKHLFANLSFDEACDRFQSEILDACRLS